LYRSAYQKLKDYLAGAARRHGESIGLGDADRLFAEFIDFTYYQGIEDGYMYKARVNQAFNGLLYAYPQLSGHMPVSANGLNGFGRLRPSTEGEPLPWGIVGVIALDELRHCVRAGNAQRGESIAAQTLTAFDSFLRISEHEGLRRGHVVRAGDRGLALLLGVDKRTKTGRQEGTVVEMAFVRRVLNQFHDASEGEDSALLFGDGASAFAGRLATAAQRLGLAGVYPHSLRHSGATHFAQVLRWDVKDLMLRGRWKQASSVHRYRKPHVLVKAWASMSSGPARLARAFELDPDRMLARARAGLPLMEA